MLTGNYLTQIPCSLASSESIEMLRFADNRLKSFPASILEMPRLAWCSWSGNAFGHAFDDALLKPIFWEHIEIKDLIAEGASGKIFRAIWQKPHGVKRFVAVKIYKSAVTGDGRPSYERNILGAYGIHPNAVHALGFIKDHPENIAALVLDIVGPGFKQLADLPNFTDFCRDTFNMNESFDLQSVINISFEIALSLHHAYNKNIAHGDVFAHNILWHRRKNKAILCDFGAASFLPGDRFIRADHIDMLAWGILLKELIDRCAGGSSCELDSLQRQSVHRDPKARPRFGDVLDILSPHRQAR